MKENRATGRRLLVAALFVLGFAGCARGMEEGPVVGAINNRDYYVALGSGQVTAGQRVEVFRQTCANVPPGQVPSGCHFVRIGNGTVTQVIDSSRSVVHLDPGTPSVAAAPAPGAPM